MSQLASHAACVAAGLRDGLRAVHFYTRDMTGADGGRQRPALLSSVVAQVARKADSAMSHATRVSLQTLSPKWRDLPSPLDLAARERLASALTRTRATLSSEFTLYFFRVARLQLEEWAKRPHLVLEHRIEAVRRNFQSRAQDFKAPAPDVLAQLLIALVEARPVARAGALKTGHEFLKNIDLNVAIFTTACIALLLAQSGKPNSKIDDLEFLSIVSQLTHNRLQEISGLIEKRDSAAIAAVFEKCMADY